MSPSHTDPPVKVEAVRMSLSGRCCFSDFVQLIMKWWDGSNSCLLDTVLPLRQEDIHFQHGSKNQEVGLPEHVLIFNSLQHQQNWRQLLNKQHQMLETIRNVTQRSWENEGCQFGLEATNGNAKQSFF